MKSGPARFTNYGSLLLMSVGQLTPMSLTHLLIFVLYSSLPLVSQGLCPSTSKILVQDRQEKGQHDLHFLMLLHKGKATFAYGSLVWDLQIQI